MVGPAGDLVLSSNNEAPLIQLRSFRDYPAVFTEGRHGEVLTPAEMRVHDRMEDAGERRLWLLRRVSVKELAQRTCDSLWGFVPPEMEISVAAGGPSGEQVVFGGGSRERVKHPLALAQAQTGAYTATCLRLLARERFGLAVQRVVPRYPLHLGTRFTERELQRFRFADVVDVDRVIASHEALKDATLAALNGHEFAVEVRSAPQGDGAELHALDPQGDALDSPVLRARSWVFDHHALAFVAAWRRPQDAPGSMERIEDDPVLPGARHGEETI